jgi:hypothetical protein
MALGVGLNVTGGRTAFLDLAIDAGRMDDAIKDAIRRLALEGKNDAIRRFGQIGTGKRYKRTRGGYRIVRKNVELFGKMRTVARRENIEASGNFYNASAPGRPPAQFTGNLFSSLSMRVPAKGKGYSARVFATRRNRLAAHRHLLEFGTVARMQPTKKGKMRNVGRVLPRPVWGVLQREYDPKIYQAVLEALNMVTR